MKITPEIAQKKLWELKIALDSGTVMEIVRLLQSGKSQYHIYQGIYNEQSNRRAKPLASNNTILKIKKLLDAGELDWMTDELNMVLDEMEKASDEDQIENIVKKALEAKGWERRKDDGFGQFRLTIIQQAEESIKEFGWSVTNLVEIGIPLEATLGMLQEFDGLAMARESSLHGSSANQSFLRKFPGFERYLRLLHLVYLMQKYPNNPLAHYLRATAIYTRGVIASDDAIKTSGEDILRYEIWRKGQYLDAYNKSLRRYKRTPKRNRELTDQIKHLLSTGDDD
ncbi:MAG: hypothetical protein CL891_01845 [Dehalococcoidia bacterium]|nr:hypothetical protein [Dehalococcoidia bacterium]